MTAGGVIGRLLWRPDPEAVVRQFGPQVFRQLRRIFGPGADIDDVYQAVFIEVLRSLPGFVGRSKLSTWIQRITWNVAYQEMRMQYRRQREQSLDEEAALAADESLETQIDRRAEMARLYAALTDLDPKERAVVIMHDIEGQTLRHIGQELGRPVPTVASQLYAGRECLAKALRRLPRRSERPPITSETTSEDPRQHETGSTS
jgi:RNA polymerase sigma-70 factor (ECF subfamily)